MKVNWTKKLWCVGFNEFRKIALEKGWDKKVPNDIAIISISCSEQCGGSSEPHVCPPGSNVLNLEFDDVSPEAFGLDDDATEHTYSDNAGNTTTVKFFTSEQAAKAVRFITKNAYKNFYIHCSAGVSRSQAFVKYIKNTYDMDWITNPNNPCIFPNGFVYSKLMEAYRTYCI
jgi:hypothetical protein